MSNAYFAVRSTVGGIIHRYGTCPGNLVSAQAGVDEVAEECPPEVTDSTHYHDGSDYVLRPEFTLVQSNLQPAVGEVLSITSIPVGTTVDYPGGSVVVDDGFLDWSCLEPGEYQFTFENFPYIPETIIATVTPA